MEISKICKEAREYGFAAVCVPPPYVELAKRELAQSSSITAGGETRGAHDCPSDELPAGARVKVATVIGFPFGYSNVKAKMAETELALLDGAAELDVVINLTQLKNGNWHYLGEEMQLITDMAHADGALVKTIIESGVLTDEEIIRCCAVYGRIGVDFLKTSTGYAEKGASVHAVQLMRQHLPANIRIKASGGIRTYAFAKELIEAGANRLGCSASVEIVKGGTEETKVPNEGRASGTGRSSAEAAANGY